MIPKVYKPRKSSHLEAQRSFELQYRDVNPSRWSSTQRVQVAHIIKWASVGFATRESIKLSKSLFVKELGQRGYVKHINTVYPLVQGHNLGAGQISTYDYRGLLKQLVRWIKDQGQAAVDEFMSFFKSVLQFITEQHGKKMMWFLKMVCYWVTSFKVIIRDLVKDKSTVTTIHESYKDFKRQDVSSSAERPAIGTQKIKTDPWIIDFLKRCGKLQPKQI